ncbi:Photosystem I assembly protein Ycf3 [Kutzneria sp. CA-103260]|nr:Photosystem I assembly protein Ycf3 [Kutzneria sp. CA-103260]
MANTDVFVGRNEESTRVTSLLSPDAGACVSYIAGMGGVGKTALAMRCVRAAVDAKRFSGGAFSVDMLGYRADGGLRAEAVVPALVQLLGLNPPDIPADPGARAAAYHQRLDALGRAGDPVLLLFDNVSAADQIRALLPTHDAHRVLITTRDTLALPGARGFSLDVPTAANATTLLDSALSDLARGDRRIADDPAGARELVRTCGRLPLALRIVAAILADEPELTAGQLAAELTEAGIVGFVHGEQAVAAVLDLSWHRLFRRNQAAARLLRLLCLAVTPTCPTSVAAVLNDASEGRTVPLLRTLRQAHLLTHTDQRWHMHDLVRVHTATHDAGLSSSDLHAANRRLIDHYTRTAEDAMHHQTALPDKPVRNRFTNSDVALRWLNNEYATLLAVAHRAAESGEYGYASVLCSQLTWYQDKHGIIADRLVTAQLAYASACSLDDLATRADMANNLGLALMEVGRPIEAIDLYRTAIDIHTSTDDIHSAAKAWNNLGTALGRVGRHDEALQASRTAVDSYQQSGNTRKEAAALMNLGCKLRDNRQLEEAVETFSRATQMCRTIGDYATEVQSRLGMTHALLAAGRNSDAIDANRTAITISQSMGDVTAEIDAWSSLGYVHRRLGQPEEADGAYQRSIALGEQKKPTGTVAQVWTRRAEAREQQGDLAGAAAAHREAVRVYRHMNDCHGEAMTSNNLGCVLVKLGDLAGASAAHQTALELTQDRDDWFGQAMTLANIAVMHAATGAIDAAVMSYREAIALFHRIRDTRREARAWHQLGMCLRFNAPADAVNAQRKALSLYTSLNDDEGMRAAEDHMWRAWVSKTLVL